MKRSGLGRWREGVGDVWANLIEIERRKTHEKKKRTRMTSNTPSKHAKCYQADAASVQGPWVRKRGEEGWSLRGRTVEN